MFKKLVWADIVLTLEDIRPEIPNLGPFDRVWLINQLMESLKQEELQEVGDFIGLAWPKFRETMSAFRDRVNAVTTPTTKALEAADASADRQIDNQTQS